MARQMLTEKNSVVIGLYRCMILIPVHTNTLKDNTNADIDVRRHWISLAKEFSIPIRCIVFRTPAKLCEHNDTVRALGGETVSILA